MFKVAFSSFKQAYDNDSILVRDAEGDATTLKPSVHMIIGNTTHKNEWHRHYLKMLQGVRNIIANVSFVNYLGFTKMLTNVGEGSR